MDIYVDTLLTNLARGHDRSMLTQRIFDLPEIIPGMCIKEKIMYILYF